MIYKLDQMPFVVDIHKRELQGMEQPGNAISFDEMLYHGDYYLMAYDRKIGRFANVDSDIKDVIQLKVPQLCELDPQGMALKYGKPLSEINALSDFKLMVDPQLLMERVLGKLPTIQIIGRPFVISLREGGLLPLVGGVTPYQGLRFKDMMLSEDESKYRSVFNIATQRSGFLPVNKALSMQDGLALVELPREWDLDPIGYMMPAKKRDRHELFLRDLDANYAMQGFLMKHNATQRLPAAEVIPWEKVGVKDLISPDLQQYITREYGKLINRIDVGAKENHSRSEKKEIQIQVRRRNRGRTI